jgi:hypothetical protein
MLCSYTIDMIVAQTRAIQTQTHCGADFARRDALSVTVIINRRFSFPLSIL